MLVWDQWSLFSTSKLPPWKIMSRHFLAQCGPYGIESVLAVSISAATYAPSMYQTLCNPYNVYTLWSKCCTYNLASIDAHGRILSNNIMLTVSRLKSKAERVQTSVDLNLPMQLNSWHHTWCVAGREPMASAEFNSASWRGPRTQEGIRRTCPGEDSHIPSTHILSPEIWYDDLDSHPTQAVFRS